MTALPWGGSEKPWAAAVPALLQSGHSVAICVRWWEQPHRALLEMQSAGADITYRDQPLSPSELVREKWSRRLRLNPVRRATWLEHARPQFCLVSISHPYDDIAICDRLRSLKIPYALMFHVADENCAPDDHTFRSLQTAVRGGCAMFFNSSENHRIIEEMTGTPIPEWELFHGPLSVPKETSLPSYPSTDGGWRLACVGRVQCASKGQDLLLRALASPEWKGRELSVTFFGEDQGNNAYLSSLAKYLGVENQFRFGGFAEGVTGIYGEHHAMTLMSRFEGIPMVTAEAMLCARIPIVTAHGRNPQLVQDGTTGFLATHATVESVRNALERAWDRRHEWNEMGKKARENVVGTYPTNPGQILSNQLVALAAKNHRLNESAHLCRV
jgi:glycosyltransferase involved in cell wall biosynthesis